MLKEHEDTQLKERYLPEGRPIQVDHGDTGESQPAPIFLRKQGVSSVVIEDILTDKGEYKSKERLRKINPRKMHPLEYAVYIAEELHSHYVGVNRSESTITAWGFADHSAEGHILPTTVGAYYKLELAKLAGNPNITENTPLEVVWASSTHDLGGLQGKKRENDLSSLIRQKIFPWLELDYPEIINNINLAIRLHSHNHLLEIMQDKTYGKTADEVINALSYLPPVVALLYVADKEQRGRYRVPTESMNREAFDNNWHFPLNYAWQTDNKKTTLRIIDNVDQSGTENAERHHRYTWSVPFIPYLTEEEAEKYRSFDRLKRPDHNRNMVDEEKGPKGQPMTYIPNSIKTEHNQTKRPYYNLFLEKLWSVSGTKLLLTAMQTFSFLPNLSEYEFVFPHPDDDNKTLREVLIRGEVQKGINTIMEKYGIPKTEEGAII